MLFGGLLVLLYNVAVMKFRVRRLRTAWPNASVLQLYDARETLLLVADFGTPWLPDVERGRVRLARPNGRVVGWLNLPEGKEGRGVPGSYVLVRDDAVYGLISVFDEEGKRPYFFVEAEQARWLVTGHRFSPLDYGIFDEVPASMNVYADPADSISSEPIGRVWETAVNADLHITLPGEQLAFASFITLALAYLINHTKKRRA
ncbi:MAG: hypothetical protein D6706_08050 [Chloroflexi bacterium]|nr:MAG: hypothetical protein D6706_08050 [Chloroflexota bacterium]